MDDGEEDVAGEWELLLHAMDMELGGPGRRLLRTSVEAAVNEKSMDSVGDAVVEEGTVYDDYIEDLKKVLL